MHEHRDRDKFPLLPAGAGARCALASVKKDEEERKERGETRDERELRRVAAGRPQDAEPLAIDLTL